MRVERGEGVQVSGWSSQNRAGYNSVTVLCEKVGIVCVREVRLCMGEPR